MMYSLSDAEEFSYASRGSLQCSSIDTGQPITPDSVLGTNIMLDGNGSIGGGEDRASGDANVTQKSTISASPPSLPLSSSSLEDDDLSSPQLLNIFKTESAEQYEVTPNYLHSSVLINKLQSPSSDSKDQGVSERCRRRTCEWMYDICDYFQLNREVVGIALFYVDRYFTITFEGADTSSSSGQVPVTRRQFQLVALTALFIAVKLHGETRQEKKPCRRNSLGSPGQLEEPEQLWNRQQFSLSICASISRDQFTASEIEECEKSILCTLNWYMNPIVSSGTIIESLLGYFPSTMSGSIDESISFLVYDCAKYLAELSVSVPALSLVYKPSVVAYSSILYALDTLGSKTTCFTSHTREEYERVLHQVSCHHFHREKENVSGAMKILQAICPNLSELFPPPPPETPRSPMSVHSTPSVKQLP